MGVLMVKKLLITIAILAIIGGFAFAIAMLSSKLRSPEPTSAANVPSSVNVPVATEEKATDPTQHDTFDIEFAKKLLLYHELAAQLDNFAKLNAIQPEVRSFAEEQSSYNTEQSNVYANLLDSWEAKYTRLADFPKTTGGGCSGYPTFPGMLPHADVNAYLQTSAAEVDKQYLALMTKHHDGITLIFKAEGDFIIYGELIKMRDSFFTSQESETREMKQMQEQYGYV